MAENATGAVTQNKMPPFVYLSGARHGVRVDLGRVDTVDVFWRPVFGWYVRVVQDGGRTQRFYCQDRENAFAVMGTLGVHVGRVCAS